MRRATLGIVVCLALAGCSGSSEDSPSPPATSPDELSLPSPSGHGFCTDRAVVADVVALVRAAEESPPDVVTFIAAATEIIRSDIESAPNPQAASKIRQLALVLNTLGLAVQGAAENYPEDFAVKSWLKDLPTRLDNVSRANACGP